MAALPKIELLIGAREGRLLAGDFSLEPSESGKKLVGFARVSSKPTRLLNNADRVGSLQAITTPGHTPGHMAFLDRRNYCLIAGDSFTTQWGLVAAGVFSIVFPFPALLSWNPHLAAESAVKLHALNQSLLSVGHGKSLASPSVALDRAVIVASHQHPPKKPN